MKRIICFCGVILIYCCFLYDGSNTKKEVIVERYDGYMSASEAGFKDEKFYACVTETLRKTSDDILTDDELATVEELICKNKGVVDVSGIEKLASLTQLNLMENNIENIDLSKNVNLMYVELSGNPGILIQ